MVYKCEAIIERVKTRVAAADPDPAKRTILAVFEFQITLDGEEIKKYTIDLKKLEVYEGACTSGTPDVMVTIEDEDLHKIVTKQVSLEDSTKQGMYKVKGSGDCIEKMKALLRKIIEG